MRWYKSGFNIDVMKCFKVKEATNQLLQYLLSLNGCSACTEFMTSNLPILVAKAKCLILFSLKNDV
jgi:hypothetical protein